MKIKMLLLSSLVAASHLFGALKASGQENSASFHYGTIGFTTALLATQVLLPNSVLKQSSNIILSTIGKVVENNLTTQVLKANHLNTIATFVGTGLAFTKLYAGWVVASEWHHNTPRNGSENYKNNACFKFLTGTFIGAGVGLALNAYVKEYLR